MDDNAVGAATAVWHESTERAQRWFELIGEQYQPEQRWDVFKQALAAQASQESYSDDTVKAFVEYVEASGAPMNVVAQLAADANERAAALQVYTTAVESHGHAGEHTADGVDTHDEFDQAGFSAYLRQWNGEWDGDPETWPNFAERVVYYAPDEFKDASGVFVTYCESAGDKVAALAEYDLTIASSGAVAAAEVAAPHDHSDGTDDVAAASLADIEAAADAAEGDGKPAAATIDVAAHVDDLAVDAITPALTDLFKEMPEAAALPPEVLRQLLADVLHEELTGAGSAT